MLDYGAPFGFVFKEKGWFKKFALASLLTYTLIGAAPVLGWMVEVVRRVAKNESAHPEGEPLLPEFTDWKTYWRLGGQFAFVNAVWLLPAALAVIGLYLPLIFAHSIKPETVVVVFGATLCCVLAFLVVYSIVYIYLVPAMLVVLARTGSSGQAVNPVRLWRTARPLFFSYLMVFLIVGVALFNAALFAAGLTLFLLLPPLLVYTGLVTAHFAGQLMRMDTA